MTPFSRKITNAQRAEFMSFGKWYREAVPDTPVNEVEDYRYLILHSPALLELQLEVKALQVLNNGNSVMIGYQL